MDYGDRQARAEWLVGCLKRHPDQQQIIYRDFKGQGYRPSEILAHVVEQTELGRSILAVAGFWLQAKAWGA